MAQRSQCLSDIAPGVGLRSYAMGSPDAVVGGNCKSNICGKRKCNSFGLLFREVGPLTFAFDEIRCAVGRAVGSSGRNARNLGAGDGQRLPREGMGQQARGTCPHLIDPAPNESKAGQRKGVSESEWKQLYDRLVLTGELSHFWFRSALVGCCNLTTIGGVFVALGIAARQEKGVYRKARGIMSKNHIRDHWESLHRNLKGGKKCA